MLVVAGCDWYIATADWEQVRTHWRRYHCQTSCRRRSTSADSLWVQQLYPLIFSKLWCSVVWFTEITIRLVDRINRSPILTSILRSYKAEARNCGSVSYARCDDNAVIAVCFLGLRSLDSLAFSPYAVLAAFPTTERHRVYFKFKGDWTLCSRLYLGI